MRKHLLLSSALTCALLTLCQAYAQAQDSFGLEEVQIVTLKNGSRYFGINGTAWGNGFGSPNGGNGRIGLIRVEDGKYVIASQGRYYQANGTSVTDLTEATVYTIGGSVSSGLTFCDETTGNYLSGTQGTSATAATYAVNSFGENSYRASQDIYVANDGNYYAALCLPFKVTTFGAAEEGYGLYIVTLNEGMLSTTAVTTVEAGQPFIYCSPTNNDPDKRLLIPQTEQAYAMTPLSSTFLSGYYLTADREATGYHFAIKDGVPGFYKSTANDSNVNGAYITLENAEAAGAEYFILQDGKLVAVSESYTNLQNAIAAAEAEEGLDLSDAISAAKSVLGNSKATADERNAAIETLQAAVAYAKRVANAPSITAGVPFTLEAESGETSILHPAAKSAALNNGTSAISGEDGEDATAYTFDGSAQRMYSATYIIKVPAGAEGTYNVKAYHCCSDTDRFFTFQANDDAPQAVVTAKGSTDWAYADGEADFQINLKEGANTLVLSGMFQYQQGASTQADQCYAPSIDKFILSKAETDVEMPAATPYAEINAQNSTGSRSNETRSGSKYGCIGLDGTRNAVFTYDAPATGIYLLNMVYLTAQNRDINVTVNSKAAKNINFTSNGSWNDATYCRQILIELQQGENTITLDGNNTNSPIIDYLYLTQVVPANFEYFEANCYDIAFDDALHATMCLPETVAIPEGVAAYTGQTEANYVKLNAISGAIPAGTPVVLKADEAKTYTFLSQKEDAAPVSDNDFLASDEDLTATGTQFCLANKEQGVGFYPVEEGTTIPAGKTYIQISSGAEAKAFYGFDEPTGITTSPVTEEEGAIYNLAGQQFNKLQKGVNIVAGKKFLLQ